MSPQTVMTDMNSETWWDNHYYGAEEMPLPTHISRKQSYGSITISIGVEEMSLPNSRRPSHMV